MPSARERFSMEFICLSAAQRRVFASMRKFMEVSAEIGRNNTISQLLRGNFAACLLR
jgi:hypothetical protein